MALVLHALLTCHLLTQKFPFNKIKNNNGLRDGIYPLIFFLGQKLSAPDKVVGPRAFCSSWAEPEYAQNVCVVVNEQDNC
jgi:hypothetical protein